MFHTCDVKIAKIAALSGPNILPGNKATNPTMVIDKNARTGTDCKTSIMGTMMRSACLFFAASVPKIKVKANEKTKAMSIRSTDRKA